ncbi:MAG: EF2563 family selenium-dependent molybdenum hydroxylase system protein [Clostridia bacterium]|nr:EF2563 family selenium-dependent molybdenum hydroxylase system protein [Clostridia bacterium]
MDNETGLRSNPRQTLRDLVIVRGAGDISTGTIHRLYSAGFPVLALETDHPSAIRRKVAFSEAVYDGTATVEGVTAIRMASIEAVEDCLKMGQLPLLVDPAGESIRALRPFAVVDAILAKKNLGTTMMMAGLTIALGPGFEAGRDVHYVIETMRGHDLGRIISSGSAIPNTGVPGKIGGYAAERVIHAPCAGIFHLVRDIGSVVTADEQIGTIQSNDGPVPVCTQIPGILRGIIRDRYPVTKGFKLADVDPRVEELKNCFTISDKARCIAGSVLELVTAAARQMD